VRSQRKKKKRVSGDNTDREQKERRAVVGGGKVCIERGENRSGGKKRKLGRDVGESSNELAMCTGVTTRIFTKNKILKEELIAQERRDEAVGSESKEKNNGFNSFGWVPDGSPWKKGCRDNRKEGKGGGAKSRHHTVRKERIPH